MEDLAGRVAVVTGAGSGIGRGIAHALGSAGVRVAVADIEEDAAAAVVRELETAGYEARPYHVDVTHALSLEALAEDIEREMGPVSVLCNNAGVLVEGPLVESPPEDWQWVFSVNVLGVIHGVREFVPRIRAGGQGGHVVNTASMAGIAPRIGGTLGVYSASKAAGIVIGEMLREELAGDGIGVSVLCPATVRTRFWSSARNRPAEFGPGREIPPPERVNEALDPMRVGEFVLAGIRENRAYIFTSDDAEERIQERIGRMLADAHGE